VSSADSQALVADLARVHGEPLRRFLRSRVRNVADVPDLLQEIFLRMLRVPNHEAIRSPESYLFMVALNVMREHARQESREHAWQRSREHARQQSHQHATPQSLHQHDANAVLAELPAPLDTDPELQAVADQRLEAFGRELEKLTPKIRATFILHRRNGLTLEQIASQLGISCAMAKKYLIRALFQFRHAMTAIVLIGFMAWLIRDPGYSTDAGEQHSLTLSDGSTVQLDALSKIRIHYTDHERDVELVKGQALFEVAKDSMRPFVVQSGPTRVTAIGTQFDVRRNESDTIVTVVEGRVAVSDGSLLSAGEQVTVGPNAVHRTPHPNIPGATAWTQRKFVFDATPLSEVAEEFNRYNQRRLVIRDPGLRDFQIDGVFSSSGPSLIRFLQERPEMHVSETDQEIVVTRRR